MPLPDLIEIVPLDKPVRAEITVPGSKSITNRALILAALADGEVTLTGALWSEDTQIMVECLQKLGFEIRVENDPDEFCNRTITVKGLGGKIPNGGTAGKPLELFVGNAGTAARFLAAFVCLGNGVYRLSGVPRMHERPQAALFQALRELGCRVESEKGNDKLPVTIFDGRSRGDETQIETENQRLLTSPPAKKCHVNIEESSQFASALLLCAKIDGWKVEVVGENAEESPYVAMTEKLISWFPDQGGKFEIEPDASSAGYFWAMAELAPPSYFLGEVRIDFLWKLFDGIKALKPQPPENWKDLRAALVSAGQSKDILEAFDHFDKSSGDSDIKIRGSRDLLMSAFQIDSKFQTLWPRLPEKVSRQTDLGDSIMTAIVLAPLGEKIIQFIELGRLRVQECERVVALQTELAKCGAKVAEAGDVLTVYPARLPNVQSRIRLTQDGAEEIKIDKSLPELHGAEIETYNDHRMAMCFAVLGLKVPGIKIKNPACVKKTFPNFFQKLAAPPPKGLGATILDAKSGRKLGIDELFAD
jgi:3-phosphoshikimate 1-carboxyvinyltransferase